MSKKDNMLKFISTVALALMPTFASAETLAEVISGLSGREVTFTGFIGSGYVGSPEFSLLDRNGTRYGVIFDAYRDTGPAIEECEFVGYTNEGACAIEGKAEIELDGSNIKLIVFEVTSLSPPAEAP